jgi:hypothetical protein
MDEEGYESNTTLVANNSPPLNLEPSGSIAQEKPQEALAIVRALSSQIKDQYPELAGSDMINADFLADLSVLVLPEEVITAIETGLSNHNSMEGGSRRRRKAQRGGGVFDAIGRLIGAISGRADRFATNTDALTSGAINARTAQIRGLPHDSVVKMVAAFAVGVDTVTGNNKLADFVIYVCKALLTIIPEPSTVLNNTLISLSKYFPAGLLVGKVAFYVGVWGLCITVAYVVKEYITTTSYRGAVGLEERLATQGAPAMLHEIVTRMYAIMMPVVRPRAIAAGQAASQAVVAAPGYLSGMWRNYWTGVATAREKIRRGQAAAGAADLAQGAGLARAASTAANSGGGGGAAAGGVGLIAASATAARAAEAAATPAAGAAAVDAALDAARRAEIQAVVSNPPPLPADVERRLQDFARSAFAGEEGGGAADPFALPGGGAPPVPSPAPAVRRSTRLPPGGGSSGGRRSKKRKNRRSRRRTSRR